MRKDYSVSLTRVIATVFIIVCHLGTYFSSVFVGQLFNVGVPIFFVISGYLYGDKKVRNIGEFLFQRYVRLEIPTLIWLSITVLSSFVKKMQLPAQHEVVFLLLNLQGLSFVFTRMQNLFIRPWFFTCIMGCYISYVIFQLIEQKYTSVEAAMWRFGGLLPLLIFVSLGLLHISTYGLLAFYLGVALKRRHLIEHPKRNYIFIYLVIGVLALLIRLTFRTYIDGTIYYDELLVPLTHIVLAVCIFAGVKWLFFVLNPFMNRMASCRLIQHLDHISIYVYISHDMLISGVVLSVLKWPMPLWITLPIYFLLATIFATILYVIGKLLTKQVERGRKWLFGSG